MSSEVGGKPLCAWTWALGLSWALQDQAGDGDGDGRAAAATYWPLPSPFCPNRACWLLGPPTPPFPPTCTQPARPPARLPPAWRVVHLQAPPSCRTLALPACARRWWPRPTLRLGPCATWPQSASRWTTTQSHIKVGAGGRAGAQRASSPTPHVLHAHAVWPSPMTVTRVRPLQPPSA